MAILKKFQTRERKEELLSFFVSHVSITYKKRYSNEFLKAKQPRYVRDKSPDLPVYDFV